MDNLIALATGRVVQGIVRHVVVGYGATLVHQGLATQDQVNQAVGAVMVLVGVGFSIYDKIQSKKA